MEIKINELRIGNIIYQNDVGFCVNKIQHIKVVREIQSNGFISSYYLGKTYFNGENIENLRAIPLTEDWLLKFGFDKMELPDNDQVWYELGCEIQVNIEDRIYILNNEFYVKNMTIHRLQNIYHSLVGEELTIK